LIQLKIEDYVRYLR